MPLHNMNPAEILSADWHVGMTNGHNCNTVYAGTTDEPVCSVSGICMHQHIDDAKAEPERNPGLPLAQAISALPDLMKALEAYIASDETMINEDNREFLDIMYAAQCALAKAKGEPKPVHPLDDVEA